ncbi:MAG: hypothetical protein IPF99_43635 [Deltaproteobacteria bacterium]|nr:hypothetical protein [Deltaproteobacteria bacterium]
MTSRITAPTTSADRAGAPTRIACSASRLSSGHHRRGERDEGGRSRGRVDAGHLPDQLSRPDPRDLHVGLAAAHPAPRAPSATSTSASP